MITKEYLHSLFNYDEGRLLWKVARSNFIQVGDEAGTKHPHGYKQIHIDGKRYLRHRLIYMMFNGFMPEQIDHINCNKSDDRIENLRVASYETNGWNAPAKRTNTSGFKNVDWHKRMQKWRVKLSVNKSQKVIGYFSDVELAGLVAEAAREKYHKMYSNHQLGN
jgi:hypothetical protein